LVVERFREEGGAGMGTKGRKNVKKPKQKKGKKQEAKNK